MVKKYQTADGHSMNSLINHNKSAVEMKAKYNVVKRDCIERRNTELFDVGCEEGVHTEVKTGLRALCCAVPISKKGYCLQTARFLALLFVPFSGMLILAAVNLHHSVLEHLKILEVETHLQSSNSLGRLVHDLQIERLHATVHFNESSKPRHSSSHVPNNTIQGFNMWPICHFEAPKELVIHLEKLRCRKVIEDVENRTFIIAAYNEIIGCLIDELVVAAGNIEHKTLWQEILSYKLIIRAKENLAVIETYAKNLFELGYVSANDYAALVSQYYLMEEHLDRAKILTNIVRDTIDGHDKDSYKIRQAFLQFSEHWKNSNHYPNASYEKADLFFNVSEDYLLLLESIRQRIQKTLIQDLEKEVGRMQRNEVYYTMVFIISLCVAPALTIMVCSLTKNLHRVAEDLALKSQALVKAKKKSDELLLQMLPQSVARQLIKKRSVVAEYYDSATVYFSDIVGFTEMSSTMTPIEVVRFLNDLYLLFDDIIESYDVYKVETIGDGYMVVSGVPVRNENRHVTEICRMALHLLRDTVQLPKPNSKGEHVHIRIGIHSGCLHGCYGYMVVSKSGNSVSCSKTHFVTIEEVEGPCAAGVVGNKMPRYCIFGDTVNTASRMESNGQAQKIHISHAVKLLLDKIGGFYTCPRGEIVVKGKGSMETYWLVGAEDTRDNHKAYEEYTDNHRH